MATTRTDDAHLGARPRRGWGAGRLLVVVHFAMVKRNIIKNLSDRVRRLDVVASLFKNRTLAIKKHCHQPRSCACSPFLRRHSALQQRDNLERCAPFRSPSCGRTSH